MPKAFAKTRKVGGSIVVTIPKEIVELEGITEDEIVAITVEKPRRDFFASLKGIGKFEHRERVDHRD